MSACSATALVYAVLPSTVLSAFSDASSAFTACRTPPGPGWSHHSRAAGTLPRKIAIQIAI
eukprot:3825467-Prymnesium_polylepis.1